MAVGALASRFGRITSSSYVRAVATLSTGQMLAAAVPLLAAPVLGRLYLPADYGVLATYMATASVFGTMSTLQLDQGIIAEHSERRALELVLVCQRAGLVVAMMAAIAGLALFFAMGRNPAFALSRWWMLALPASTIAASSVAPIIAFANRQRRYGMMARAQVYSVVATVFTSIAFGAMHWGAQGLFASYFIGQAISVGYQLWLYGQIAPYRPRMSMRRTLALGRRHRRYAIYTLPSELMGSVQRQLPIFMLSGIGAATLLGGFSRARSLLSMPLTLLGSSIGQVFRQRASEQFRLTGSCGRIYAQTFWALLLLGLPATVVLMLFAPELFRIVLGPRWTVAGQITRIIAPTLLLQLVCSPISTVFYFLHYQRDEFLLSIGTFALILISAFAVFWISPNPMAFLYVYAAVYSLAYVTYIIRGWMIASGAG